MNRREFLEGAAALAGAALAPSFLKAANGRDEIAAVLLHLGHNMWCEWLPAGIERKRADATYNRSPDLKLVNDERLWREVTDHAAARGLNMVVIDIGEALVYPRHPELGIEGSWSPDKLRAELDRLRKLGLEPIPKLNFSATHDGWLKDYHRMLTLPKWYEVAKDVINDVVDIFDKPRFFHLGWDEEREYFAKGRDYFVMRQGEMWWHDFLYTIKCVEDRGVRAWVWSDKGWVDPSYFDRCPKTVVQSNWFYDECHGGFDPALNKTSDLKILKEYFALDAAGFDQIPCGTNWAGAGRQKEGCGADDVIGQLVRFGRANISGERLLGFMMASWAQCDTRPHADFCRRGIDLFADARSRSDLPAGGNQ